MKSAIVRRNAWEINTSFYFLSSCSDAHWGPLAKQYGDVNEDVAKKRFNEQNNS